MSETEHTHEQTDRFDTRQPPHTPPPLAAAITGDNPVAVGRRDAAKVLKSCRLFHKLVVCCCGNVLNRSLPTAACGEVQQCEGRLELWRRVSPQVAGVAPAAGNSLPSFPSHCWRENAETTKHTHARRRRRRRRDCSGLQNPANRTPPPRSV